MRTVRHPAFGATRALLSRRAFRDYAESGIMWMLASVWVVAVQSVALRSA